MGECDLCDSKLIPLNMNSNYGKLLFASIILLLLVISFVLLLHAYARWLFIIRQSAAAAATTTTHIHDVDGGDDEEMGDGLDAWIIASIPVFVQKSDVRLECVICLSSVEDGEVGRHLPNCNHAFHAECIDKWFRSHSSCPICRALVGWMKKPIDSTLAIEDILQSIHINSELSPVEHETQIPMPDSNSQCSVQKSQPPPPPPLPPLKILPSINRLEQKIFPSSSSYVNV